MADVLVDVLGENAVAKAVEDVVMLKADVEAAADAAIATVVWFYPFKDIPDEGSPLRRIREIRLIPSVADQLPDRLSVRTLFRDTFGAGGAERFNFLMTGFSVVGGVDTYTPLVGLSAGGALINPNGIEGTQGVELKAASGTAFAGVPNGTTIGGMTFDFDDGGSFGSGTAFTIDQAELDPGKIQMSAGEQRAVTDLVGIALADEAAAQVVSNAFARPVASRVDATDIYLRRVVQDVKIWGTKPGKRYRVGYLKTQAGAFEIRINEEESGRYVATAIVPTPTYTAEGFPEHVRFNINANNSGGAIPGGYTGISGYVSIDPTAAVVDGSVYQFADFAESGLAEDACISFDEVTRLFWHSGFAESIKVAPGTDTLMEAVRDLYDDVVTDEDDILKTYWCPRAGPHHQIVIDLAVGEYFATNLFLPDWVSIRGKGKAGVNPDGSWDGKGTLIRRWNDNRHPPIQDHFNSKLLRLTVYSDSDGEQYPGNGIIGQYCVHSDINNAQTQPDAAGDVNFQINQLYKHVRLHGGPDVATALWGSGLSTPGRVKHRHCEALSDKVDRTGPLWASHTCANAAATPSSLEFDGCVQLSQHGPTFSAVAVQSVQPFQVAATLIIDNCPTFARVSYSGTVDGGWEGCGDYSGPFYSSDADVYLNFSTIAILRNGSGAGIAAKKLCKLSDNGLDVSLAADGELVDAVSIFAVAAGATGRFIISARTDYRNVGLGQANGTVYVNAGTATTNPTGSGISVGRAKNGIVEFKRF